MEEIKSGKRGLINKHFSNKKTI
jgi:dynein heavy chain 2